MVVCVNVLYDYLGITSCARVEHCFRQCNTHVSFSGCTFHVRYEPFAISKLLQSTGEEVALERTDGIERGSTVSESCGSLWVT